MGVAFEGRLHSDGASWDIESSTSTTLPDSRSVIDTMSYQYPPPSSGPDLDLNSNMMNNNYHLPAVGQLPQQHSQPYAKHSPTSKIRATNVASKNAKMRRSASTPNVRGQAASDAAALSAEKKRNKLGYHRTSVACGHCRRRKIRCIPAVGDAQQRCQNCIRLKKECVFYPVDNPPQSDAGRRDSSVHGAGNTSASSSPTIHPGQLSDMHPGMPYPHLSIPPNQDLGGPMMKRPRTDSFSPDSKGNVFPRAGEYAPPGANWVNSDSVVMPKPSAELSPLAWRVNNRESPMAPNYSPYQGHPAGQQPNWTPTEPGQRDETPWSVPQRAMSFPNIEGMPGHSPYTGYSQGPAPQSGLREDFTPRSGQPHTDVYANLTPTPGSATAADARTRTPVSATHAPGSAGPPPQSQSYGGGNTWGESYTYNRPPVPSSGENFSPWYGQGNSSITPQAHSGGQQNSAQGPVPTQYGQEAYAGMYYQPPSQGGR